MLNTIDSKELERIIKYEVSEVFMYVASIDDYVKISKVEMTRIAKELFNTMWEVNTNSNDLYIEGVD